ncbi:MAG: hypothetical protein FJ298_02800 [Planctomycetes bacterium]|nr:hypothetical protein [Planctomycetota bacterium]
MEATGLWTWGWAQILAGFASGALVGLRFEREGFLGGYSAWSRRLLRLGHIACIALGMLQMLVALSPAAQASGGAAQACFVLWKVGGVLMPAVCWLSAWRASFRHWFALPVLALSSAAVLTLVLVQQGAKP